MHSFSNVYTNVEMEFLFLKIKAGSIVHLKAVFFFDTVRNRENETCDGNRIY